MAAAVSGQFRVENAGVNAELVEEEFESIAFVHRIDEQNRFAGNEFQLEERVHQHELVLFFALELVLDELQGRGKHGLLQL